MSADEQTLMSDSFGTDDINELDTKIANAIEWIRETNKVPLDSYYQLRVIEVRNELRKLGWTGEDGKELSKGPYTLKAEFKFAEDGRSRTDLHYEIEGVPFFWMSENRETSASEMARKICLG